MWYRLIAKGNPITMTPQPELAPRPNQNRSTGPTTQAGKDSSRLNALRHGLSGQTVLMPWEDREAYQSHCASFLKTLAPVGDIETQTAQGIADDQWRLNRARAVDTNLFALGHFDYAPETGHPQIDAALTSARVFRDNSKVFVNLSLYEQRINRSLEKNFDRLEALQATRRAQEHEAKISQIRQNKARLSTPPSPAATPLPDHESAHNRSGLVPTSSQPKTPSPGQFVCSTFSELPAEPGLPSPDTAPDPAHTLQKAA